MLDWSKVFERSEIVVEENENELVKKKMEQLVKQSTEIGA